MKAARRHELKENDLSHAIEVARVYLADHGTKVGFIVLIALVVAAVVGISVRTRAANVERAWLRKSQLVFDSPEDGKASIDKLSAMMIDAPDEGFVLSSLIEQGGQALRLAQQVEVPPDPDLNNRARDAFESLLERFGGNPLAFGLAHSGLATVEENEFALDALMVHKDRAAAHLQAVIDNPALDSLPFRRIASDRLDNLGEIFTIVRFAPPELPEMLDEEEQVVQPVHITSTPVMLDETPPVAVDDAAHADESDESEDTP